MNMQSELVTSQQIPERLKVCINNDFTTSIKISLVRRYYFICTPFLPPVDLYPFTLDMLTFSGDLFFYLLTYINLSCSAILLYSVYQLR